MAKVLIVDDNEFTRMMLENILKDLQHEVIQADSAKLALELYKSEQPDVVFMDVVMDDIDGIQAVSMLKEIDPEAKIIMCSAQLHEALQEQAEEEGALTYLSKPFDRAKIEEALKAAL